MKQEQNLKRAQIFRFNPPFETARALSQLFAVQCGQWEPIQNGQLIRIYKEISPSPHSKLPEHWVNSSLSNVANESPFEMVN